MEQRKSADRPFVATKYLLRQGVEDPKGVPHGWNAVTKKGGVVKRQLKPAEITITDEGEKTEENV